MRRRHFVIPSLMAAGLPAENIDIIVTGEDATNATGDVSMIELLRLEHEYNVAAHRSHSSHGSHRSHRSSSGGHGSHQSHRSSAGGSVVPQPQQSAPSRESESTPPSSILPRSPSTAPQKILPGNSGKFISLVRQLQTTLYAKGYYTGAIDGIFGPQTRAAISKFQKDYGLKITGSLTPETLDALQITVR